MLLWLSICPFFNSVLCCVVTAEEMFMVFSFLFSVFAETRQPSSRLRTEWETWRWEHLSLTFANLSWLVKSDRWICFRPGRRQRSWAAPEETAKLSALPPTPPPLRRAPISEALPPPCSPSPTPPQPTQTVLLSPHITRVVGVCGLRVGEAASSQPASLPVPAEEQPNVLLMSKPVTPPPPAHPSLDPAASVVPPTCPSASPLVKHQVSRTPSSSTFISALQSAGGTSEEEEDEEGAWFGWSVQTGNGLRCYTSLLNLVFLLPVFLAFFLSHSRSG